MTEAMVAPQRIPPKDTFSYSPPHCNNDKCVKIRPNWTISAFSLFSPLKFSLAPFAPPPPNFDAGLLVPVCHHWMKEMSTGE